MKKLKNQSGFSLIEMLAAVGILAIMVVGMGSGISAGTRAYSDAVFHANSANMADIVNSAVGDALRFGDLVRKSPENGFVDLSETVLSKDKVDFVFTNYEYGVLNAYFDVMPAGDGSTRDLIWIKTLQNDDPRLLVNTGSYPDLDVENWKVSYQQDKGYFDVEYDIVDMVKAGRSRHIKTTVRLLNFEEPVSLESYEGFSPRPSHGPMAPIPAPKPKPTNPTPTPTAPKPEPSPEPTTEATTEATTEPTTEPTTAPTTVPTEPEPEPTTGPSEPTKPEYPEWELGGFYKDGDIVTYKGKYYICKFTHIAFSNDWNPADFPNFWDEYTF